MDTDQQGRLRLDELLVARGDYPSRSRARDAIARGAVMVEGERASKPGQRVAAGAKVEIDDPARRYVARSALKLAAGLDSFGLDPGGLEALDIGASTGGFTEILLERGALHVHAIDIGHGQLAPSLAADPRVTLIEGLNARHLTLADLGGRRPRFVVCDVSFISLRLALPPALDLAGPGASGVFLVKPQFEAGPNLVGKGGVLRDRSFSERIAHDLCEWLEGVPGWRSLGFVASPIRGSDGNQEYLLAGAKDV